LIRIDRSRALFLDRKSTSVIHMTSSFGTRHVNQLARDIPRPILRVHLHAQPSPKCIHLGIHCATTQLCETARMCIAFTADECRASYVHRLRRKSPIVPVLAIERESCVSTYRGAFQLQHAFGERGAIHLAERDKPEQCFAAAESRDRRATSGL
jgi:hypothetical protein